MREAFDEEVSICLCVWSKILLKRRFLELALVHPYVRPEQLDIIELHYDSMKIRYDLFIHLIFGMYICNGKMYTGLSLVICVVWRHFD